MKRYSVNLIFANGQRMDFKTNTNVLLQRPVNINGAEMIITEDGTSFNVLHLEKMRITENVKK